MFGNKSSKAAAVAPPLPVDPPRRTAHSSTPSILAADLVVNGTITSIGDIQIDCRLEGDVKCAGLVIGENAQIQGDVLADELTVRGLVHGNIRARRLLLCSKSRVEGNIQNEAFSVELGAIFEGNYQQISKPSSDGSTKRNS